jgi:hypothetical protein
MKKASRNRSGDEKSRLSKWLLPIMPALVTGVVSIICTLLITGNLFPRVKQGTSEQGVTQKKAPVLNAPELSFSSKRTEISLADCMSKAKAALDRAALTGQDGRAYYVWGYQNQTTGFIWCNTDEGLVIYLAAGPNSGETSNVMEALRRSF